MIFNFQFLNNDIKKMRYFLIFSFLSFSIAPSSILVKKINFNQNTTTKFITYSELQTWAYFNQLKVEEDKNLYGMKDNICHFIPPSGFNFRLIDDIKPKNIYVYLDMAVFHWKNFEFKKPRFLKIYINEHLKKTVFFTTKKLFKNPIEVEVLAKEKPDGKIKITLESDPSLFLWCIWDSYFLYEKETIN